MKTLKILLTVTTSVLIVAIGLMAYVNINYGCYPQNSGHLIYKVEKQEEPKEGEQLIANGTYLETQDELIPLWMNTDTVVILRGSFDNWERDTIDLETH